MIYYLFRKFRGAKSRNGRIYSGYYVTKHTYEKEYLTSLVSFDKSFIREGFYHNNMCLKNVSSIEHL